MTEVPMLSILDAQVTVSTSTAQAGQRLLEFRVELSAPTTGDVSMDFRALDGTAAAHLDYPAFPK